MSALHLHVERNTLGRDFVVGDIHGEFGKLCQVLSDARFDSTTDRLFSVGDMVDRGPDSLFCISVFMQNRNFYAVRGNHEQMCIDSSVDIHVLNGGAWYYELDDETRKIVAAYIESLPYAITIDTHYGPVGIVHAQPQGTDWNKFIESLDNQFTQNVALWSRDFVRSSSPINIDNITRVYCGHTVLDEPKDAGNISFIDTGAVFGRALTIVQISP